MDKQIIIDMTVNNIRRLPATKFKEVNDFVEFLINKIYDQIITHGIWNCNNN